MRFWWYERTSKISSSTTDTITGHAPYDLLRLYYVIAATIICIAWSHNFDLPRFDKGWSICWTIVTGLLPKILSIDIVPFLWRYTIGVWCTIYLRVIWVKHGSLPVWTFWYDISSVPNDNLSWIRWKKWKHLNLKCKVLDFVISLNFCSKVTNCWNNTESFDSVQ